MPLVDGPGLVAYSDPREVHRNHLADPRKALAGPTGDFQLHDLDPVAGLEGGIAAH